MFKIGPKMLKIWQIDPKISKKCVLRTNVMALSLAQLSPSLFGLKSQKLNEILRFVNLEITRFFPFVDTQKSA